MKLTPKDLTTIEAIFRKMVDEAEARINIQSKAYIDALRRGYVTRSTPCCTTWEKFHEWWFVENGPRWCEDRPKASILTFRGEGFNYCPFCGVKL